MRVTPRVATTLGGLLINEGAQVLDRHGRPIEGLAAAGDAVGGIFGCSRRLGIIWRRQRYSVGWRSERFLKEKGGH